MLLLVYFLIQLLLSVAYLFIILRYSYGWNRLQEWSIPPNQIPSTFVSVIIAARNEERSIKACMESVLLQSYPKQLFEVLIVNDHSTDDTAAVVQSFSSKQVRLLELSQYINTSGKKGSAYKKAAIEYGIKESKGSLIVTTDADCIVPEHWLLHLVTFYEAGKYQFIAAPVQFYQEKSLLERFQALDFLGMMLINGAGIQLRWMHLCNGANLAYTKTAFHTVNGFEGIEHLASGDDLLLLHKIAKAYPGQIGFLKSLQASVITKAKHNWSSFMQQRLRWATKSASYQEWQVTLILALVFFLCCSILLNLLLIPFFGMTFFYLFLAQVLIKTLIDYYFLGQAAHYFKRTDLMRSFLGAQILHIAYIISIGIRSNLTKTYTWKGRKVK